LYQAETLASGDASFSVPEWKAERENPDHAQTQEWEPNGTCSFLVNGIFGTTDNMSCLKRRPEPKRTVVFMGKLQETRTLESRLKHLSPPTLRIWDP
jgi:hypothetical protein